MAVKVYVTNLDQAAFERSLRQPKKELSWLTKSPSLTHCAQQYSVTSAQDYFLNFPDW